MRDLIVLEQYGPRFLGWDVDGDAIVLDEIGRSITTVLTRCCQAYSTYGDDGVLCCKVCFNEVGLKHAAPPDQVDFPVGRTLTVTVRISIDPDAIDKHTELPPDQALVAIIHGAAIDLTSTVITMEETNS